MNYLTFLFVLVALTSYGRTASQLVPDDLFQDLWQIVSQDVQKLEEKSPCAQQLDYLAQNFIQNSSNITGMIYNSGRDLNDLGYYDNCRKTDRINGQIFNYVVFSIERVGFPFSLYVGICGPSECGAADYNQLIQSNFDRINATIWSKVGDKDLGFPFTFYENSLIFYDPQEEMDAYHLKGGFITTIIALSVLVFLGLVGTSYGLVQKMYDRKQADIRAYSFLNAGNLMGTPTSTFNLGSSTATSEAGSARNSISQPEIPSERKRRTCLGRFVGCFDILRNSHNLFYGRNAEGDANLNVLNGVRVISMGWIILGHSFFFTMRAPLQNMVDAIDLLKSFSFSIVLSAPFAVDTFFFLSGLLTAYVLLSTLQKRNGRMQSIPAIYLHRYIRMLPLYLMVMLIFWFIVPYLGDGPTFFKYYTFYVEACDKYWWTHFLYINNLYPLPPKTSNCIGWTWYLPNDMQFFLIAPFLILLYYRNRKYGLYALLGLQLSCWIIELTVVSVYGISASQFAAGDDYQAIYYQKPWNRISPFIIGLLFAYAYHSYKNDERGTTFFSKACHLLRDSRLVRYPIYILGLFLTSFFVFYQYYLNNHTAELSQFSSTMFLTFSRPCFVLGMCLIVFPAILGKASVARIIPSHDLWTSFARMTFAAYLIHPILMNFKAFDEYRGINFNILDVVVDYLGYFVISYTFGCILTLIVETPCINLEKEFLMRPRRPRPPKQDTVNYERLSIVSEKNDGRTNSETQL